MSTLAIVLIVIAALLLLLVAGGFAGAMRRREHPDYERHLAEADRALEHARAADKGWDRPALEAAARDALAGERPEFAYNDLALVLVDDKPGISEDRAHFLASGGDGEARVVLARRESGWALERVE